MSTIRLKVFISSVQKELREERAVLGRLLATDPFLAATTVPRLFEEYPAPLRPNKQAYLALLRTCNVYLLMLGGEYGTAAEGGLSPTHQEYQLAQELRLPTLVCVKGDAAFPREPRAQAFLDQVVADGHTYSRFSNIDELQAAARERLIEHIREEFDTQPTPQENQTASETLRVASDLERRPEERLTLQDLDEKLSRELVAAAEDRPAETLTNEAIREALLARSYLWFDPHGQVYRPTLAGALLLAREPARAVAHARIQLDAFRGTQRDPDPLDSVLLDAPLPHAVEQAVAFVRRNSARPLKVEGLRRQAVEAYPQEALREAIVNAVAHRDYAETGAKVTIEVFADRIVVASPGRPPGNQPMERISQGEARSRVRNPLIVQGLTWLGFMDERGSGIRRMQEAIVERGGRRAMFDLNGDEFAVTLFALPEVGESVSPVAPSEPADYPGSTSEREVVKLLRRKGWVSSSTITQKLGIAKYTAVRLLNEMIGQGLLRKEGVGRSTRYLPTEGLSKYLPVTKSDEK